MSQPFFYCSELSRQRGEPRYGTASVGEVWLLVEYPFWWGRNAFAESHLPTAVKTHLTEALAHIPRARLLLIKQDRPRRPQLKFFVVRTRERAPFAVEFTFTTYEELIDFDIAAAAAGRTGSGNSIVTTEPLYLICTHGRRDKCCAKFGYPLYRTLRAAGHGNVWQSSHVGGDRFAANLICYPHGLFYAHVTEADAQTIIHAYDEQRIVPGKYRGRACYGHAVQAAEYFVRAESGLDGLADVYLLNRARVAENSWRVNFAAPRVGRVYEALVSSRVSAFHQFLACNATEEKSVEQFGLDDYRVTSDHTLAPA
ncbi:MAG TPA: sucrase ferredoxin [Pyrinomonadaceae bacterium]|jgi:hypothetical protein